jgi:carbon monoxide dehydrogenase subunit G
MPQGIHEIEIDLPISTVWDFVSVMENWIPLVPGYISHQIINDRQSTWSFHADIGIIKKQISLQVDITEWSPPNQVTFNLSGINENFVGEGYFKATALGEKRTKMTGYLDITAKGVKAPMINPVLKSFVPRAVTEMMEAIANRLKELAVPPPTSRS